MEIPAIHSKASNVSAFSTRPLAQALSTGLSEAKVHPKASMRKFMGESAASVLKIQVEAESSLDSHYDNVVKDLQKLVNIEECKRALKDLNRELENFDRDLADPKLSPFEREIKIFQKPFRYRKAFLFCDGVHRWARSRYKKMFGERAFSRTQERMIVENRLKYVLLNKMIRPAA